MVLYETKREMGEGKCCFFFFFFGVGGQGDIMKYKNISGVGEKIGEFEASTAWKRH